MGHNVEKLKYLDDISEARKRLSRKIPVLVSGFPNESANGVVHLAEKFYMAYHLLTGTLVLESIDRNPHVLAANLSNPQQPMDFEEDHVSNLLLNLPPRTVAIHYPANLKEAEFFVGFYSRHEIPFVMQVPEGSPQLDIGKTINVVLGPEITPEDAINAARMLWKERGEKGGGVFSVQQVRDYTLRNSHWG